MVFVSLVGKYVTAQKEADNWIVGSWAGLNFNTGSPVIWFPVIPPLSNRFSNGTIMSDSLGNLLFCSNGNSVWNKLGEVMDNGDSLKPGNCWTQAAVAFPKPGEMNQYYLFTVAGWNLPEGIYYSVIDMSRNGGLGAVTEEKNIELQAGFWAHEKLFVTKNESKNGYWVISRLYNDDRYVSFFVNQQGVHTEPVYSPTGIFRKFENSDSGPIKISPDKKYLVAGHTMGDLNLEGRYLRSFEICSFDPESGNIDYLYMIHRKLPDSDLDYYSASTCEFSPDSKFMYLSFIRETDSAFLYQYEIQYVEDSLAFVNSAELISAECGESLQLLNDGRIYSSGPPAVVPNYEYFMGVIDKPWKKGTNCDFDPNSIYPGGRKTEWQTPNILLDYLYRFEWEVDDYCQGSPVHFIPNFIPTPDSVEWFFDEFTPGNYSNELSPTYTFQYPGIHEVSVDIWYPTGRFEHTSREIGIFSRPDPDLGPDTLICEGNSITLYANCEADFYTWNGIPGGPQYNITDSGFYRVSASFLETGCSGCDTIHVGYFAPILLDESSLVVTPTSCGGTTGSVTGLVINGTEPLTFLWEDFSGNVYGNNPEVFNLPAGQYVLTITDANDCTQASSTFTITDAGNLLITDALTTDPHCGWSDGQLTVSAFSPSGSILEYSIDDGNSYTSDSIFSGLSAGSYIIRIRDTNGCEGFYLDNPVILQDIPGPQVLLTTVTDETDFLQNGSIDIAATGSTPQIFYSIDNGNTWQINDGLFSGLQAGIYSCIVKDENDCDTTFTVDLQNVILTFLQAITGPGEYCLGNAATVPVEVDNFNSVASFRLKLSYNADNLVCEGYTNVHPQLQNNLTGWVDQAAGEITFQWQDTVALTFSQPDTVAELVFTTKHPGMGDIGWFTGATESYFTNINGSAIPAEFHTGEVNIYEPPSILLSESKTVCEGQMFSIMGIASGNHPPMSYLWTYPGGQVTDMDPFFISITNADAGDYRLLATDIMGCTDQKTIRIEVSENPVAAFHNTDTLRVQSGYLLDAGAGWSSYRWNTGDTTESIVINAEGMYTVMMESPVGCIASDSVYLKLTSEEIPDINIYIPNAFTPDGDGINDTFKAVTISLSIEHLTLSIYDRWGGEIFEADGIENFWDGKKNGNPCPGGVYVYRIAFKADGIPGEQVKVGTVMLVR